jgi:type IV fimbrial biogenesis protein FimT
MTVLELLTAIGVIGMLLGVGLPALDNFSASQRMLARTWEFLQSVHIGWQTAQSQGVDVAICKSNNGTQCTHKQNWQTGWIVFANVTGEEPPQVDPEDVIVRSYTSASRLNISANRDFFILRPHLKRSTNGTLIFCDHRGSDHARAVIVSYTGKPRVTHTNSAGKPLPCPAQP